MLLASIRLGFLLATLITSFHVVAAPRFWTLTGVGFAPTGTVFASGYFSYDDATQTIASWNVHVALPPNFMPAFTYVPGNSSMSVSQSAGAAAPTLVFSAVTGVPGVNLEMRYLQITPLVALDGSNATVSLDTSSSREYFPSLVPPRGRTIAGSLVLTAVPPPVVIAEVDEFYHAGLRHYFITADDAEKQALDTGVHPGWVRTGESFKAYAKGSRPDGSVDPVCRFYSPPFYEDDFGVHPFGVDSHFFSADAGECANVFRRYENWLWFLENDNAFQIDLPDKATGTCPGGTIPVYRLWNQRTDSNHRYATSAPIKADMLAAGYVAEGYGADGVVMCAVQ
jgi:hypothetical protein